MALNTQIDFPSVKYGAASLLKFGCAESEDFEILESSSQTASYQTDLQVKNEVGNTIGQVIGDPKLELTLSGFGSKAPKALGATTEYNTLLAGVGSTASAEEGEKTFCIKSVKQDNSNEDFVKFEISAEHYFNLEYGDKADLTTGEDEFGS